MSGTIETLIENMLGNMSRPFPATWKKKAMDHMWEKYRPDMIEDFVRHYCVGLPDDQDEGNLNIAMDTIEDLHKEGYLVTLDTLGEKSKTLDDIKNKIQIYVNMAILAEERGFFRPTENAIAAGMMFPYAHGLSFSAKPSTFTLHDENDKRILGSNKPLINFLHLFTERGHRHFSLDFDMEEDYWVDDTVQIFSGIKRIRENIDIVHQTNLDRTEDDLKKYIEDGVKDLGVRLCIGIYDINNKKEWSEQSLMDYHTSRISRIGTMNKRERKTRLIEYAKNLAKEGVYVKIATHDTDVIEHMAEWFNKKGISKEMYEFQALYNVKPKGLDDMHKQLMGDGTRVRIYLPFAPTLDDAVYYGIRRACKNHQLLGTFAVGAMKYYAKKILSLGMAK
jgi:hypothetical protein